MDIFVGRDPYDMRMLIEAYERVHHRSIARDIEDMSSYDVLRLAIELVLIEGRPDRFQPVDNNLVHQDVQELMEIRRAGLPNVRALLRVLLLRNDEHLLRVATVYHGVRGVELDKDFRKCYLFGEMTRAIAVHAIRSAIDPIYRDAMLLRDSRNNKALLGVRMTRMHWYPQHWSRVKWRYEALEQESLIDRMNRHSGIFRDLTVTMAQVPTLTGF
jgi:hypothetical protein